MLLRRSLEEDILAVLTDEDESKGFAHVVSEVVVLLSVVSSHTITDLLEDVGSVDEEVFANMVSER